MSETAKHTPVNNQQEIQALTAQRDALLAVCKWVLQEIGFGNDMAAAAAILHQAIGKAIRDVDSKMGARPPTRQQD